MPYLVLACAVLAETIGTAALQASQQFTKLVPSVIVVLAYGTAFYLLAIALKFFPVGIAYAIWSGLGIVFISIIGFAVFSQTLDAAAVIGIGMILAGILIIHLFSTASPH